jgi:hypothetical protein
MSFKPGYQEQMTIFTDSPDTGEPECVCSYCGEVIEEDEIPLRIFFPESKQYPHGAEYRLHWKCVRETVEFKPE